MKKLFYLIILLFSLSISIHAITKEEAVDYLIKNYPGSQLKDIYKSFYQDNFGPGHILGDSLEAKRYFYTELQDTTIWGGPEYEMTGEGKNFVRLNMDLVRNGIIPANEYFQAFQNSLARVEKPSDELWISEWEQIDSIISAKGYILVNDDENKNLIQEKLKTKNFPIHHSQSFNDKYNFHYRIISIPEFMKLKERYLSE